MVKIIEPPVFALSLGAKEKSIQDLTHFANYVVNPRSFQLYVGKDQHIHSESLTETSLSEQVAQLFKRTFDEANFDSFAEKNKRIFRLAQKAFAEILSGAAQDPDALKYLAQLQEHLESAPESQAKTVLIEWIQETRQQWKLNPKKPCLVYRRLQEEPKTVPEHPNIAQIAKDGFTKLKKEHSVNQALAITVTPFLTFPSNLEKMLRESKDVQVAAREVAEFYQAIKQIDQLAPDISSENRMLIQNCLKIYALKAEMVICRYKGGENALKDAFKGQKRPSEELSPEQSVPVRR